MKSTERAEKFLLSLMLKFIPWYDIFNTVSPTEAPVHSWSDLGSGSKEVSNAESITEATLLAILACHLHMSIMSELLT